MSLNREIDAQSDRYESTPEYIDLASFEAWCEKAAFPRGAHLLHGEVDVQVDLKTVARKLKGTMKLRSYNVFDQFPGENAQRQDRCYYESCNHIAQRLVWITLYEAVNTVKRKS